MSFLLKPRSDYAVAIFVVLGICLAVIFFDAYIYDVLAYHGPFSAITAGISRLNSYRMSQFMHSRFVGFPPLWRWALAPGFALGMPRFLLLPNLFALLVLVWCARRSLSLPWSWTAAATLIFPISLFGFRSAYQDFFVAALISSGVLCLISSLQLRSTRISVQAVLLLLLPALTKYQGLFQAALALILAIAACLLLDWRRRNPLGPWWKGQIPVYLAGLLLLALHPIHNLITLHNPFFPIATSLFAGPEPSYAAAPTYTKALVPFHALLNHFFSATELDWIARGVVPSYTIDQARAQTQYGGVLDPKAYAGLVRTGGAFGPTYLLVIGANIISIAQAWKKDRLSCHSDPIAFAVLLGFPYIFLAAFLPQSHELRYYLALLILPGLFALGWGRKHWPHQLVVAVVLSMLAISFTLNFTQPIYSTLSTLSKGHGLDYAIHYPSRDLPTPRECLAKANKSHHTLDGRIRTNLSFTTAEAFACRLMLSNAYEIVEGDSH